MINFIEDNLATIIICAFLAALVIFIIAGMIKNKRAGKTSCECGSCPMNKACHKKGK